MNESGEYKVFCFPGSSPCLRSELQELGSVWVGDPRTHLGSDTWENGGQGDELGVVLMTSQQRSFVLQLLVLALLSSEPQPLLGSNNLQLMFMCLKPAHLGQLVAPSFKAPELQQVLESPAGTPTNMSVIRHQGNVLICWSLVDINYVNAGISLV